MGRKEKLIGALKKRPSDFGWDEMTALLKALGYKQTKTGKAVGSRHISSVMKGQGISTLLVKIR
jgi:hypothetical protein